MGSYRLQWDVRLRTSKRLFCDCPPIPPSRHWRSCDTATHKLSIPTSAHPSVTHRTWQECSPSTSMSSAKDIILLKHKQTPCVLLHPPKRQPSPMLLEQAMGLVALFGCQTPSALYVIRHPQPKYEHLSGYQHHLLLGFGGTRVLEEGMPKITSVLLKEEGYATLTRHPHQITADTSSHGRPLMSFLTEWSSTKESASLPLLANYTNALLEALLTTDQFEAKSAILTLYYQAPGGPHWALQGRSAKDLLPFLQDPSYAPATPPGLLEWREHEGTSVHRKGWQPTEAKTRDPLFTAIPTPHVGTSPFALRWRWRDAWRYKGCPDDILAHLLYEGRVGLFEQATQLNPQLSAVTWGELFGRWPKALARQGAPIEQLTEERWMAIASLHAMDLCHREALFDLLAYASFFLDPPVQELLRSHMGVVPLTRKMLRAKLPELLRGPPPRSAQWEARERFWMGRLMKKVRGSIEGHIAREELYRLFSEDPPTPLDRCPFPPPGGRKHRRNRGRPTQRDALS